MDTPSPQKENGFTSIANEILEATQQYKFTLNELKIVMCVWRFTYGFNRKSHQMSLSFFENQTGIGRKRLNDSLKKLVECNVLMKETGNAKYSNVYSFNKYYTDWKIEKYVSFAGDTSVQNATTTSVQGDTTTSVQDATQERKIKESIKDITAADTREVFSQNISTARVVLDRYKDLRGLMFESPNDMQAAFQIEQAGVPPADAVKYLEEKFEQYERTKKHSRDQINSLSYCTGYILDRHHQKTNGGKVAQFRKRGEQQKSETRKLLDKFRVADGGGNA